MSGTQLSDAELCHRWVTRERTVREIFRNQLPLCSADERFQDLWFSAGMVSRHHKDRLGVSGMGV